jgi:hypothetical protein
MPASFRACKTLAERGRGASANSTTPSSVEFLGDEKDRHTAAKRRVTNSHFAVNHTQ